MILFTKAGGQWLELMAQSGCNVIGVDWSVNLGEARQRVGSRIALQGNLDPSVLCQTEEVIRAEVARILTEYGPGPGHIFNLGHGVRPDVPPEHVAILVDAVHTLSNKNA
jgi:uroporphyrinogen decarboxylase